MRLEKRANKFIIIAVGVISLLVASPVLALEDCNEIQSAWQRAICFVAQQVELMIELYF